MNFEQYLSRVRRRNNPSLYLDELSRDLGKHLVTIDDWLKGEIHSNRMLAAMKFINKNFGDEFKPTKGKLLYRGQNSTQFDGTPRSYSYNERVAQAFAVDVGLKFWKKFYLITREVCYTCPDKKAFILALDVDKVLKSYTGGSYGGEEEVILLNYPVKGNAEVFEVEKA